MGALSIFPKLPQQTRDELANRHLKKCFLKPKLKQWALLCGSTKYVRFKHLLDFKVGGEHNHSDPSLSFGRHFEDSLWTSQTCVQNTQCQFYFLKWAIYSESCPPKNVHACSHFHIPCMFRNVKLRSKAPNDLCLHYITITFTGFKNSNVVYKLFS